MAAAYPSNDQRLHNKIFWFTLGLALFLILAGFLIEKLFLSYSLLTYPKIESGSYGFQLAKIPSRKELDSQKVVVLLGNSVYQYNHIPRYMQFIADEFHNPVHFLNMAQISSTIYDHLVQVAKVVHSKPDLVIIAMNNGTFSLNPRFKTDVDQIAFDPEVLKAMPASFYTRVFTYQTAVDTALSSLLPLKRADPLIRWYSGLHNSLEPWFLKWFSYPYLNVPTDKTEKVIQMTELADTPGDEKYVSLQEILNILRKYKVPVLFIWQEANQEERAAQYQMITKIIKSDDNALFVDLTSYWNKESFFDMIHPKRDEESRYGMRHYLLASEALTYFGNKTKQGRP